MRLAGGDGSAARHLRSPPPSGDRRSPPFAAQAPLVGSAQMASLQALLQPEAAVAQLQAGLQALQAHPAGVAIIALALGLLAAVALRL